MLCCSSSTHTHTHTHTHAHTRTHTAGRACAQFATTPPNAPQRLRRPAAGSYVNSTCTLARPPCMGRHGPSHRGRLTCQRQCRARASTPDGHTHPHLRGPSRPRSNCLLPSPAFGFAGLWYTAVCGSCVSVLQVSRCSRLSVQPLVPAGPSTFGDGCLSIPFTAPPVANPEPR